MLWQRGTPSQIICYRLALLEWDVAAAIAYLHRKTRQQHTSLQQLHWYLRRKYNIQHNTNINVYKRNMRMHAYNRIENINSFFLPLDFEQSGSYFYYYSLITDSNLPFREGSVWRSDLGNLYDTKLMTQNACTVWVLLFELCGIFVNNWVQLGAARLYANMMTTKRGQTLL